jgi:hypothetical protein
MLAVQTFAVGPVDGMAMDPNEQLDLQSVSDPMFKTTYSHTAAPSSLACFADVHCRLCYGMDPNEQLDLHRAASLA